MDTKFGEHILLITEKDLSYFSGVKITQGVHHGALQGLKRSFILFIHEQYVIMKLTTIPTNLGKIRRKFGPFLKKI